MYDDKTLICRDCGREFVFTAGEQVFFARRPFLSAPHRCHTCRKRRKHSTAEPGSAVLYEIVCSKCGEIEKIPFEPSHDRPVFCSSCYKQIKEGKDGK